MPTPDDARADLRAWSAARLDNFFSADTRLAGSLKYWLGQERFAECEPSLRKFGGTCAARLDSLVQLQEQPENRPQLVAFDELGERTNSVVRHPAHDDVARCVWESGLLR